MKNTLGDLNNHLFAQLERLGDEELKGEDLKEELERAKMISLVAIRIIDNGTLLLDAQKFIENSESADTKLPKLLEGGYA